MHEDPATDSLAVKDRIEQLGKLADDRWREYTDKTTAEWRVSFGIWLPLTAAIGGLITLPHAPSLPRSMITIIEFSAAAIGLAHLGFLLWIQSKLKPLRQDMRAIYDERKRLLGVPSATDEPRWPLSPLFQLVMTVCLLALLVRLAIALAIQP